MTIIKISMILILCLLFLDCTQQKLLTSKIISKDGLNILYGEISKDQLFYDFPEWEKEYNLYHVNNEVMDSVRVVNKNSYAVDIFLGTWCVDSKREVPRFLKILDENNIIPENGVKLFAVDRKKKLRDGEAERNNIKRVATFIVKKDSKEIGRIIEFPNSSLEKDLLELLTN